MLNYTVIVSFYFVFAFVMFLKIQDQPEWIVCLTFPQKLNYFYIVIKMSLN